VKYASAVADLRTELSNSFTDFKSNKKSMHFFSTPFSVPTNDVPGNMQMEIIEPQCNSGLKEKYSDVRLFDFYSKYIDRITFPAINSHTLKMVSHFGSNYLCEHLYTRMKHVHSNSRTRITKTHLENSLRIDTSQAKADIDRSVKINSAKFLTKDEGFFRLVKLFRHVN
jgi:17beta-estradiol 17-dehydrogenase/3beta-hydroxysteroid 3-dehydrogenase/mitotic-spindle organizing protein 1